MKPVVAIVGRPNVSKSTLFNRLLGKRKALVQDEPGITRDLNYGDVEEGGRVFTLVDTGGFEPDTKDEIFSRVKEQATVAIEDSDLVVLVLDGRNGIMPTDSALAEMLRKSKKPLISAINKMDTDKTEEFMGEFYSLGAGDAIAVSAETGRGLDTLMDKIVSMIIPVEPEEPVQGDLVRVAIVGRPNAGKSSLLNKLVGKERAIVSSVAGTTRDSVDTLFSKAGKDYLFVDTAGIRKKTKVSLRIETYSVMEAIRVVERSDVALLVIDAQTNVTTQDERIAGIIAERYRACVVVVNKWDLVEKDLKTADEYAEEVKFRLKWLPFVPVVFTSALTGKRVERVFTMVDEVVRQGRTTISTGRLNKALGFATQRHTHPAKDGREVKFYYATQTGTEPVTFTLFVNRPRSVEDAYRRYLVNTFMEEFGLDKVPIKIIARARR